MPENTPRSSFLSLSIIALLLLTVIVLGYFYATSPTEDQLDAARQDITALESRLESMRDELTAARDDLTAVRFDFDRLERENRDLSARIEARGDADRSLDECEAELAGMEAELKDAEAKLARLEAPAAANATDPLQDELEACRTKIAETTAELDEAQSEIAALREELQTLRVGADTQAAGNETNATQCEEDKAALRSERDDIAGQLAMLQETRQEIADRLAECQESRQAAARGQDELQSTLRDMKSEYQDLVDSLRKEIDAKSVVIEQIEDRLSINILGEILFSLGSRRLRPEGRELLAGVAENLSPARGDVVYIIGHTDTVPIGAEFREIFPSNWDLSAARAASVARFLLERDVVPPERIAVMGMAEHHPIADNDTAEGRAKNRRVEILIGPELYGN